MNGHKKARKSLTIWSCWITLICALIMMFSGMHQPIKDPSLDELVDWSERQNPRRERIVEIMLIGSGAGGLYGRKRAKKEIG